MDSDQEDALQAAYRVALGLLARREHSRYELRQKLQQRGHSNEVMVAALDKLMAQDYLSEERFTDAYVHMRRERGYGPTRIKSELRERGVADELISHYLAVYGGQWDKCVERVYTQRFGEQRTMDLKERARQQRFLQYRGFTHEQIRLVLG